MRNAETELFKDKIEISLDGRQVFYLFFGGAVIASLVFVLGVMIGKRVEARAHVSDSAATDAEKDPLAALDQLSVEDTDLAFPNALAGDGAKPLGEVDRRLAAREDARRKQRGAGAPSRRADESDRGAPGSDEREPPAKEEPEEETAAGETREREARDDAEERDASRAAADDGEHPAQVDRDAARFTLQISSFQDRAEAESLRDEMKAAGYSPYIVQAEVPDKGTWFRVRIGFYAAYDDAIAAKKRFEADRHIIAYVTRIR